MHKLRKNFLRNWKSEYIITKDRKNMNRYNDESYSFRNLPESLRQVKADRGQNFSTFGVFGKTEGWYPLMYQ